MSTVTERELVYMFADDAERLRKIETAARGYRAAFRAIKRIPIDVDLSDAIDEERDELFAALGDPDYLP